MSLQTDSVEKLMRIKITCAHILQNNKDIDNIKELEELIHHTSPTIVKTIEPIIFSVFFPILKNIAECKTSFKRKEKQQIVDTFKAFFGKVTIDKLPLFFNIYGFLLFEIYDHNNHSVLDINEEYKLSIVECMTSLIQCLSSEIVEKLYVKENAPKLCQMVYVLLELGKNEQFKTLRISAINGIMAIARVLNDDDFNDIDTRNQVAEIFLFFLPGVASQLKSVALIDEKFGHKIPSVALKAWGRIVILMMQDYNAADRKISLNDVISSPQYSAVKKTGKWKNEKDIKDYIEKSERSPLWYKDTDKQLQHIIVEFTQLTHHSHANVRFELANMSSLLIDNCIHTMPTSISHLMDIIIALSEDSDPKIAKRSKLVLEDLSEKLSSTELKALLDNLEEGFYGVIASIPRKFNGIDEKMQLVALNSLIGYIRLFGKHNLTSVLHSAVHLNKLILTLIHISEFDRTGISLLEEYTTSDYEIHNEFKTPWKTFRLFKETSILDKIETICCLLAHFGASSIISDFLLDLIVSNSEHKKEAIFLLNETIRGMETSDENFNVIKNIISTYIDPGNWYLPLSVMIDENGYEHTLSSIQSNVIQICLTVEGIGKIALHLKKNCEQFMLKTLYLILERAGSAHPLIRTSGVLALANISTACDYPDITTMINKNIDYFSFHIARKLNKARNDSGGLNVLAVVLKYSSKEVTLSTCEVVNELLVRTDEKEKSNLNEYFHVFKIYIQCLQRWFDIKLTEEPFKTKKQKQESIEHFKVSNIEEVKDFSDSIMGKSAEEMWKEEMGKTKADLENEVYDPQEFKKTTPPVHIKLTVAILKKSLHSLPSKNQTRKLLVLETLKNGIQILKDWEDELLPIVHQIWSPLVDRFKEKDPLIVNYSFQLLVVLVKLSKDFIRSRTAKDVMPHIIAILEKLFQESYFKDKGSAYRYSQNFKLQLTLLSNMAQVIIDLDMLQSDVDKISTVIFKYMNDKQPIPLQKAALDFFTTFQLYDPEAFATTVNTLIHANPGSEYEKNVQQIETLPRVEE